MLAPFKEITNKMDTQMLFVVATVEANYTPSQEGEKEGERRKEGRSIVAYPAKLTARITIAEVRNTSFKIIFELLGKVGEGKEEVLVMEGNCVTVVVDRAGKPFLLKNIPGFLEKVQEIRGGRASL